MGDLAAKVFKTASGSFVLRDEDGDLLAEFRPDGHGWWTGWLSGGVERTLWEPYSDDDGSDVAQKVAVRLFT